MKERGDSLLKQTENVPDSSQTLFFLMKAKHSTLEMKHFVRER